MSKPLTKRSSDYSGAESFSFGFSCDICGKEWKSPVTPFETDGMAIEHEEARTLLWAKEHSAAFEQANLEAHIQFNLCPLCGKWVCDSCFVEKEQSDVCRECGNK
jgi:hypothetical protein